MATDVEQNWSNLSADVVDRIAEAVKQRNRWHYDGRALRRLNRHWRRCITRNIREVRPGVNRTLYFSDVKALSTFSRATEVNISVFLRDGVCDHDTLERQLAAMPSVKSLIMKGPKISSFLKSDAWARLTRLPESEQYHGSQTRSSAERPLGLQLEELDIASWPTISSFSHLLTSFPTLKKLSFDCVDDITVEDIGWLNTLESVSLSVPSQSMHLLPSIASLTRVTLSMCQGLIETLAQVKSLESITIQVNIRIWSPILGTSVDLEPLARLERLREIHITNSLEETRMWSLWIGAPLEHVGRLVLGNCRLSGSRLKEKLPCLTTVRLRSCMVLEVDAFISALKNVKELSIDQSTSFEGLGDGTERTISWSHDRFPELSKLRVSVRKIDSESATTLFSLTRLEELNLHYYGHLRQNAVYIWLDQIRGLKRLRKLTLHGIPNAKRSLSPAFVSDLDVFYCFNT